ncbi:hypothetical protein Ahia01_000825200 [Argonauta hians]
MSRRTGCTYATCIAVLLSYIIGLTKQHLTTATDTSSLHSNNNNNNNNDNPGGNLGDEPSINSPIGPDTPIEYDSSYHQTVTGYYSDIFPLSGHNFTEKLLTSKDPWIVVFHNGFMSRNWQAMAESVRGVVWVGMVNRDVEKTLLNEIGYATLDNVDTIIYPYGTKDLQTREVARNANDAKFKALKSLPDVTKRLDINYLQDFLLESYMATPSRFPTVLITEEEETCPLFKALSLRFGKYFNFARLVKPSPEDFQRLGTGNAFIDVPSVLVMVTDSSDPTKTPEFKAILYTKDSFGEMNYPNLLHFFFTVNHQFRYTLPGIGQSFQKTEEDMEDILEIEKRRFDSFQTFTNYRSPETVQNTQEILDFDEISKQEL